MDRPTVMIVDDEPDLLDVLGRFLEKRGLFVIAASNPYDVARLAFLRKPALIVLDVMMPGLDGEEVSAFLAKTPEIDSVPRVFFSGSDEDKLKRIAAATGSRYVLKSDGFRALYGVIAETLGL